MTLFRCYGLGHITSECTNKRVITLAEFETSIGTHDDEDPGQHQPEKEVEIGPDGECLVMRPTLIGKTNQDSEMQREASFRTCCTIRDKVCSLVVASQNMVTKLSLPTDPHRYPYDIQWLNQRQGICVISRVLLSFTIGQKYKDDIWCDILPMDSCHVLLSRPWLFDRRVTHEDTRIPICLSKTRERYLCSPWSTVFPLVLPLIVVL
ncbi:putative transcription factor interactor and regulator CCHC(Zn) family [Helianthus annuus]|nr:putative transcription factor interactor and regulator CCHC(Zn) family [Helianthus annuus]KAJ0948160.1 putative transcription factor interactor and regulator CCHC(Zn) family [Helianthus annuus]